MYLQPKLKMKRKRTGVDALLDTIDQLDDAIGPAAQVQRISALLDKLRDQAEALREASEQVMTQVVITDKQIIECFINSLMLCRIPN